MCRGGALKNERVMQQQDGLASQIKKKKKKKKKRGTERPCAPTLNIYFLFYTITLVLAQEMKNLDLL
jgi:hypothetical protein